MKIVIFGLSISSSWGNGHATLWRGLLKALSRRGHRVTFFERDTPYYAAHRDLCELPGIDLVIYPSWEQIRDRARRDTADCDAAILTSYCPDATDASDLILASDAIRAFYDLDAPITLARLRAGEAVDYVPPQGYSGFDVVLSYTGGGSVHELKSVLGAKLVIPVYGSVDPDVHHPVPASDRWRGDLSYLGTFAADRQAALTELFVEPARRSPALRFVMGGAMYDNRFPWTENIFFHPHVAPADHPSFYCSSRATLNVTRAAMAESGWCPSGRLFEAAACGAPIITDQWEGLSDFFSPGSEIMTAGSCEDVLNVLSMDSSELRRMALRARQRVLDEHTAAHRAVDFENALAAVPRVLAAVGSRES